MTGILDAHSKLNQVLINVATRETMAKAQLLVAQVLIEGASNKGEENPYLDSLHEKGFVNKVFEAAFKRQVDILRKRGQLQSYQVPDERRKLIDLSEAIVRNSENESIEKRLGKLFLENSDLNRPEDRDLCEKADKRFIFERSVEFLLYDSKIADPKQYWRLEDMPKVNGEKKEFKIPLIELLDSDKSLLTPVFKALKKAVASKEFTVNELVYSLNPINIDENQLSNNPKVPTKFK